VNPASAVTVACCQAAVRIGQVEHNRARIREAVLAAASAGANIVVVPELANCGYMFESSDELRGLAEPVHGPTVREWEELAARRRLVVVGGFAELGEDGRVYNTAVLIDETGLRGAYRKTHLWNTEKTCGFVPGSVAPPVIATRFGRIGMVVCYDLEFPELVRVPALERADLVCAPANWPLSPRPAGERPNEIVRAQASAAVNRMFVAVADRTGTERGQDWLGGSVIIDADGYPVTPLRLGQETLVTATIDLARARDKKISERNDVLADRRPELYGRCLAPPGDRPGESIDAAGRWDGA
jgi:predicted amidohydrolase